MYICTYLYLHFNVYIHMCMYIIQFYNSIESQYTSYMYKYIYVHIYIYISMHIHICVYISFHSTTLSKVKLQVVFCKRATNYRALLREMTYKDKTSYWSSPPCTNSDVRDTNANIVCFIGLFCKRDL